MSETPVVFCIDAEPDPRVPDRNDPTAWHGLERLSELLPALRDRLSELTGRPAAFAWFLRMDPQVAETWGSPSWAAERYEDLFARAVEDGDEIGLHTHTWRWDQEQGEWIGEFDDRAWQRHCVEMSLGAFERAFGRRCSAHRGGDHLLNGEMLSQLGDAGVRVDLTVEPGFPPQPSLGKGEHTRGLLPDYRGVPLHPYRSSAAKFPAPDPAARNGPLLIPMLSAPGKWPPLARKPMWPGRASRVFRARLAFALVRDRPAVIGVAIRSKSALMPWWEHITANLEHLARRPGMVFMTATRAADHFENGLAQSAS